MLSCSSGLLATHSGDHSSDDLEPSLAVLQRSSPASGSHQLDKRYLHKLGHEIAALVSVSWSGMRPGGHFADRYSASATDAADPRSDRELRAVPRSHAAIIGFDRDSTVVRWNPAQAYLRRARPSARRFAPFVDERSAESLRGPRSKGELDEPRIAPAQDGTQIGSAPRRHRSGTARARSSG
jgi:hypothetical protein